MNLNNPKQLILSNLEEEKSCFNDLVKKLKEQKKAIERQDEKRVLQVIEEKVATQLQSLPPLDIASLAHEGEALKQSLERLLEEIIRMEEECEQEIGSTMQEVEKRILGLQEGKKIGKGYGRIPKIRPLISKKI